MDDFRLLQSQKNQIYNLISATELDHFNFEWELDTQREERISRLVYKPAGHYFNFDIANEEHYAVYSPGSEKRVQEMYPGNWANQMGLVSHWLENVVRESNSPNLWQEVDRFRSKISIGELDSADNSPFSHPEYVQIQQGIQTLQKTLTESTNQTADDIKMIHSKMNNLSELAKHSGRMDWFHTSLGLFFTLSLALAMSPEQAQIIWDSFIRTISGVVNYIKELNA